MAFTEYRMDSDEIGDLVKERTANLISNRGLSNLLGFALHVIAGRIAKEPLRYRDYGPYWPALKDVLARNGYDYGPQRWPLLQSVYCGRSDVETVVMADEFRTWMLARYAVGTNRWMLDADSGEEWILEDSDVEALMKI